MLASNVRVRFALCGHGGGGAKASTARFDVPFVREHGGRDVGRHVQGNRVWRPDQVRRPLDSFEEYVGALHQYGRPCGQAWPTAVCVDPGTDRAASVYESVGPAGAAGKVSTIRGKGIAGIDGQIVARGVYLVARIRGRGKIRVYYFVNDAHRRVLGTKKKCTTPKKSEDVYEQKKNIIRVSRRG